MGNKVKLTTAMVAAVAASIFALPTVMPAGTGYTFLTLAILLFAVAAMLMQAINK